jgi:peptidoglycan/xylan/chitin deacetylase (PgdA/CDA1 family)
MMNKTIKRVYSKMEGNFSGKLARSAYFSASKASDYMGYKFSGKLPDVTIVLTFDDIPTKASMKIPEFLSKNRISATFFVPACANDSILKRLVILGHELGGHGWSHEKGERKEEYMNAPKIFARLRKFDRNVISWRFPWLSYTPGCLRNIRSAGFRLDSSSGSFFPQNRISRIGSMDEMKFLRLPTKYWMDLGGDPAIIGSYVASKASKGKGIIVLPFHIYEQAKNFDAFCSLIKELQSKGAKFSNLRDAYKIIR